MAIWCVRARPTARSSGRKISARISTASRAIGPMPSRCWSTATWWSAPPAAIRPRSSALNKTDGSVVWQCAVPGGDPAGYASIVIGDVGGVRQYIQFLGKGLVGIDAKSGKFLWRYDKTSNGSMNAPTPIFSNSSVSAPRPARGLPREACRRGRQDHAHRSLSLAKLQNHHGGLVLVGDNIYGTASRLMCVDFATGKVQWKTVRSARVRSPPLMAASMCEARTARWPSWTPVRPPIRKPANHSRWEQLEELLAPSRDRQRPPAARDQGTLNSYDVKAAAGAKSSAKVQSK